MNLIKINLKKYIIAIILFLGVSANFASSQNSTVKDEEFNIGSYHDLWIDTLIPRYDFNKNLIYKHPLPFVSLFALSNPNCPTECLNKIANSGVNQNPRIYDVYKSAVASNPRIPANTAYNLAANSTSLVKAYLLQNPNALSEAVINQIIKCQEPQIYELLALNPKVPAKTLYTLALSSVKTQVMLINLALNKSSSKELKIYLAKTGDRTIRTCLAQQANQNQEVLTILSHDGDLGVRSLVAANNNCTIENLTYLVNDKNSIVRQAIASNPNASSTLLSKLSQDQNFMVRAEAAHNKNISLTDLKKLSIDSNGKVRYAVVLNPITPLDYIYNLSSDKDPRILTAISQLPKLDSKTRTNLLKSNCTSVLASLALRVDLTETEYLNLAQIDNSIVKTALASNKFIPYACVKELLKNGSYGALLALANNNFAGNDEVYSHRDGLFNELYNLNDDKIKIALAKNDLTPVTVINSLATEKNSFILRLLVINKNTPTSLLLRLANTDDIVLSQRILTLPNLPNELYDTIYNHAGKELHLLLAGSNNTPVNILNKLSNNPDIAIKAVLAGNSKSPEDLLESLLNTNDKLVLIELAKNGKSPDSVLVKLSQNAYDKIRLLVAQNPNTDTQTLSKLSLDPNPNVRASVAKNLKTPSYILEKLVSDNTWWILDPKDNGNE